MTRKKTINIMNYMCTEPEVLDQSSCAAFDDFPYVSLQEKILKAQASGQAYDELIRRMYTDKNIDESDPESYATELDEADNGVDMIEAYHTFLRHRHERDIMLREAAIREKKQNKGGTPPSDNQSAGVGGSPHPAAVNAASSAAALTDG